MSGVLTTVLNAPGSGELIQKNALNMIFELLAHLVTDAETQGLMLSSLSTLETKLNSEKSTDANVTSSVLMLLDAVTRQVRSIIPTRAAEPARGDRNDAEEGEVVVDIDAHDGDDGFTGKRARENGGDEVRHIRQRPAYTGRQFGGERSQHR